MRADTRAHLEMFLVVLLGGRAAEQLTFAEVTAGAGGDAEGRSDLARATRLATRLETDFGFGSLGLLCLAGDAGNRDLLMFDKLRAAVGATIDRAYATALDLLSKNQRALDALAAALFAAGYLDQAEIEAILVQTPLRSQANTPAPAASYSEQPGAAHGEPAGAVADTAALIPSGIVNP